MHPTATERDALFEAFARALFRQDMDALYQVVSPNFVWRYHDGCRRNACSPTARPS